MFTQQKFQEFPSGKKTDKADKLDKGEGQRKNLTGSEPGLKPAWRKATNGG
jgi:hypothetical protein